ncbi:MAG: hypothetical protein QXO37_09580 [Candidatus Nitrosocaldaceae archaeon]
MIIEVDKIKRLEEITVHSIQQADVVNLVLYNNEYYCVDDIHIEGTKVKARVIVEVNSIEELYEEYVRNNLKNPLNPYNLLLLYKQNHQLIKALPRLFISILEQNKDIDQVILEKLNEQLKRSKVLYVDISILNSISNFLRLKVWTKKEIEEIIESLIVEIKSFMESQKGSDYVVYPDAIILSHLFGEILSRRKKHEEEKEEEKVKKIREEELKDVRLVIDDNQTLLVDNSDDIISNSSRSNDAANYNINYIGESRHVDVIKEEEMVERVIAFKISYPKRITYIDFLIEKAVKIVEKLFARAGVSIQST